MSDIVRYVRPNTECINGVPRPEHHFWLRFSDYDDHQEVAAWVMKTFKPYDYQFWPETVATSPTTSATQFHVILQKDRDAALFLLRW
jgi:hypothetical protein